MPTPEGGLALTVDLRVTKLKRQRCTVCRLVRVVYRLSASDPRWQDPVINSSAKCASCAGFR